MNMQHRFCFAALVAGVLLSGAISATQARQTEPMRSIEGLGTISFPTSTRSAAAQTAFLRGALLLHLFEYPDAARAFRQAQQLDPDFAMAYWGEAMTYNHGIWNQLDADAGRKALAKLGPTPAARAAKAPTPREKAYLAAVEILYADSDTKPVRDARYDEAMEHLAKAWPDDNNAQLFHALALMGRSEGVRDVPAYLRAGAISERIFRLNPQDPGAAHYWIHAMDDPAHAAGALEPARALSKISPAAAHAQHMTSHIFMALGLWDDVAKANEVAMHVMNVPAKAEGRPLTTCDHYTQWLEYAYYQQGRFRDAGKTLQACLQSVKPSMEWASSHAGQLAEMHSTPAMFGQMLNESLMQMRAIAVVESGDGNGFAAHTAVDTTGMGSDAGWNDFTDGYAAIERHDLPAVQRSLSAVSTLHAASQAAGEKQTSSYLAILQDDLAGLLAVEQGKPDNGVEAIRRASRNYEALPFDFGPPVPIKPPHELLGEQLLKQGKAADARVAFETALKSAPGRSRSLLGRARAEAASGDTSAATATYKQLLDIWHTADADLPELAEAKGFVAAHP
ncbi:tetratricopeptide repeat protein [Rhodanobacter sp. Root561]|uniref:tetratricopeptide repeat protein n=1 Tax=Rhodanobacter sp. Root561 TaxID=1736560 RepID=UPI000AE98663|nr:tetratricopeptide repeat protein [Rhodanobacter sp. Root561]